MANIVAINAKDLAKSESINRRFSEILGENSKYFIQSVVNSVSNNNRLLECDGMSVWGAAMNAAVLGLPVDNNLSYAAIVPYGKKAQFQIMTKGYIQLAIDTGLYKNIHVTEVYEDELQYYDSLRGVAYFTLPESWKQRDNGEFNKIIGYFAYFELLNGFSKEYYMTKQEVQAHGKKYSKSFNFRDSVWQSNFDAMGKKTVLKNLLRNFGKLGKGSNLDKAIQADQGFVDDLNDDKIKYYDNPLNKDSLDSDTNVIEGEVVEVYDETNVEDEFRS